MFLDTPLSSNQVAESDNLAMLEKCPECDANLAKSAIDCKQCGWISSSPMPPPFPTTLQNHAGASNGKPSTRSSQRKAKDGKQDMEHAVKAIVDRDFSSALQYLNRAILKAKEAELGECYGLRGFVRLKLKQFEHVIDDCTQSIKRIGNDAEKLMWRAAALGELRRWREAFEDLAAASQSTKSDGASRSLMESFYQPAMDDFQAQIQRGDDTADVFYDRGSVYFCLDQWERANRDFDLALEYERQHGQALVGKARVAVQQGHYEEAIALVDRALQRDKRIQAAGLKCRAEAYAAEGNREQAFKDMQAFRLLVGKTQGGLIESGCLYHQLGVHTQAIECFDDAEALGDTNPAVFLRRGATYYEMGAFELAIEDYSRYIELVPKNAEVWTARGTAHRRVGKPKKALKDYEQALKLDDVCVASLAGKCRANLALNRYQHALDDSEKALRLDSLDPGILLDRGRIYLIQKRTSQAIAEFDKALELERDLRSRADLFFYVVRRSSS